MATLQKIRNNAGLLISIVIGLALLSFILGDLFRSGDSMFSKSKTDVAEIAGKKIDYQMFQGKIEENIENYKRNSGQSSLDQPAIESIRQQTWDQVVREYIMEDNYESLGIAISGEELFDMVQGNNIDPQIMQIPIFQNKETGQFDRNLVIQFLKQMELDPSGNAKSSWTAFEVALVQQKIDQKYNTLIEKGLFSTTIQAKKESEAKNLKVDFEYVDIKYNTVSDSAISFTQNELKAYYEENIDKYKQEESREINYVTFPVLPSNEDSKLTQEGVENLKQEFNTIENNQQFVNLNSDIQFDGNYYGEEELSSNIRSLYSAEVGTVFGSYKENEAYKISKVVDFKNLSDSVQARHILIRPSADINAQAKADSLLALIKKGASFAELAQANSEDGSAAQGGDLGWFKAGAMVPSFNDACFFGAKGDLVTVTTQFGVHIIEILNQSVKTKKVQIATLAHIIEPSSTTYQQTYAAASKFGGSNRTYEAFKAAADKESLNLKTASVKKDDKNIANLEDPRQIIRWAYQAKKGDVSEIFELGDIFVVATVKSAIEAGTASFANVSTEVERDVKIDKKAEYLIAKMNTAKQNATSIQVVAQKLNTLLSEAKNATYAAYSIAGLGFEPEVQAAVVVLPINQISDPIKGKNGVFVVQVNNIQKPSSNLDINSEKNYLTRSYRSRVGYQVYEAIKEASDITDNRSNFY